MEPFTIAMLVQIGGSILGAFTSKREKQPISFEEKRYNRLRSEYTTLAKQFKVAQNTAAAFTGRPASDFKGAAGARTMFKILERRGWKREDTNVAEKSEQHEVTLADAYIAETSEQIGWKMKDTNVSNGIKEDDE